MPKLPRDIKQKLDLTASLHNGFGSAEFINWIDGPEDQRLGDTEIADKMNVTRQTVWGWRRDYHTQYKMEGIK